MNNKRSTQPLKIRSARPRSPLADCSQELTPLCLQALYNISYTPQSTNNNSFGIVELSGNTVVQSDVQLFLSSNNIHDSTPTVVTVLSLDGGELVATESSDQNSESDADVQVALGLTHPQPVQVLQTGGGGFDNFLDGLDASYCTFLGGDDETIDDAPVQTCGVVQPPNVISVSYIGEEHAFPVEYLVRECLEFGKLGMMGTTVLFSSGDHGAQGHNTHECLNAEGAPTVNLISVA